MAVSVRHVRHCTVEHRAHPATGHALHRHEDRHRGHLVAGRDQRTHQGRGDVPDTAAGAFGDTRNRPGQRPAGHNCEAHRDAHNRKRGRRYVELGGDDEGLHVADDRAGRRRRGNHRRHP